MARPRQDQDFEGLVRWRILELFVSGEQPEADDIYVSFSSGREHGPIIERVGNDSPRILALDEYAIGDSYTTDPQLQRLGCWFIDARYKNKSLYRALAYLTYYWNRLGADDRSALGAWYPPSGKVRERLDELQEEGIDIWNEIARFECPETIDTDGRLELTVSERFQNGAKELLKTLGTDNPSLFGVGLEFQGDLDNGIISKDLRHEFENNNIPFSDSAVVSTQEEGNRWQICVQIRDEDKVYIVRQEEDKLNIYDNSGERLLGSEQKVISTIRNGRRIENEELMKKAKKWLTILLWSYNEKTHTEELGSYIRDGYKIQGYQGCGDLSMNFWNVALIRKEDIEGNIQEHFIYPFEEPVEQRNYTCLVKWKRELLQSEEWEIKREAAEIRYPIEIRELKFNRQASPGTAGRASIVKPDGTLVAIANMLEFAVYGQQVVKERKLVDLRATLLQYSDLRHIFLLPNLNPDYKLPTAFDQDRKPSDYDEGRDRIIFSRRQSDDVWLGEFALLRDRNRRMAALNGPVSFELSELGATEELIEGALYAEGPEDGRHYEEEKNPLALLETGQWRKTREGREIWYEIHFRRNEYPSSIIGVTEDGRILSLACKGPYSHRDSWKIEDAAKHLASRGVVNALLIDEGGDVYQYLQGETNQLEPGRDQVRATFLIATRKREANDAENDSSVAGEPAEVNAHHGAGEAKLEGLWKGVDVSEEDIEEAKQAVFRDAYRFKG